MTKGKIKWYNKKRGFGLIVSNDKEFFFIIVKYKEAKI